MSSAPHATATFTLNGTSVDVSAVDPNTPLSRFIRARGLTGTKEGCAEGDCGACSVLVSDADAEGRAVWRAACSCITFVPQVAGRDVVTVEGLATGEGLHPVQATMMKHGGDQCGFCTPGFCVSMAEQHAHAPDAQQACRNLDGNLCRCTGYRPIRDAMAEALALRDGAVDATRDPTLVAIGTPRKPRAPGLHQAHAQGSDARFVRPASVDELLRIKRDEPDAVLVAGATELGVLARKRYQRFGLLVSTEGIAEMRSVRVHADRFEVGGAATLTHVEEAVGPHVPALGKMLAVFASRQIRNRATLAGNIATASPIGDLPPVLLALDAVVVCASLRGVRRVPIDELFIGYRKTALDKDEVIVAVEIPRPAPSSLVSSYKVSKRRELDISIVSACFRVDVNVAGLVTAARLAFGGVAPTPVRVRRAEEALLGKTLSAGIDDAAAIVFDELKPISDARASLGYRGEVARALVHKWARGDVSDAQDLPLSFTPGAVWPEPDASRALRHESARGHVTGSALYVDDIAERRLAGKPTLELWPVTVPHARAALGPIDTRAARAMPGVRAVLTGHDVPGENDVGAIRKDEPLLPTTDVRFFGQAVAVVVADSLEEARRAAQAVVVQATPMTPVLGIDDAITQQSFHTEPHVIARGDPDGALARAPHKLSGDVRIGGQEHFYLETHAVFAEPGEDGEMRVTSSTQHPSEVQAVVSHVLHLPRHQVVVQAPRMGGGFGGKETQGNLWAALAALAAHKTGHPVRVMLDRDVDMEMTGKRHPFLARFDVGFDDDGRVQALRADLTSDGGFALDLSESICDRALFHMDNAYALPHVRLSGRVAKTNVVSHTAFRGFGGPQGMLVIEEILSRVAGARGLPLDVVRERNFMRASGDETPYGQVVTDNRVPALWARVKESAGFAARRAQVDAHNEMQRAQRGGTRRGLAITPVKFGISFTASFLNQAGALVLVYRDGTVQVNHGGTEMGQGLHTKILGIAMRELGVSRDRVRVMKTQTDKVPNTSATAASAGADLNGAAVKNAITDILERLRPVAAELLATRPEDVVFVDNTVRARGADAALPFARLCEQAYLRQVQLWSAGSYRTPDIRYDRARGRGTPFHYFAYGVCVAEVELDVHTGMKRVQRVDILHDVGDSLNPLIDRGQVEGGFVQGVGWLTGEELVWNDAGRLLTHSASTYQIPTIGDAPASLHVALWDDVVGDTTARQTGVVHGSKAVGEPPLMLALAVREALRDAVAACGRNGPIALPSPLTHEQLFHLAAPARDGVGGLLTKPGHSATTVP